MKPHPSKQKSLSISNKSNRMQRKSESKRKTNNTLSTLEEREKQKNKLRHLSKTLNFSKPYKKSNPHSAKNPYKNKASAVSANKAKPKNNRGEGYGENKLKAEFHQAIIKVFNVLDIFSRGTISQANISRWVPDAALYFLGSVFQKIRNNRIVMNLQEFQSESSKIFEKSAESDIRFFVESISRHNNFNDEKLSLDGQIKQTIQSHVEDRFTFLLEGETSFRQTQTQKRSMMPLQAKYPCEDNQENKEKCAVEDSQKKLRGRPDKGKIAPLNNINSFQNVAVRNQHRKILDVQNLPLQVPEVTNKSVVGCLNGVQSPFFQGSISSVIAKTVSNRRKQHRDSEKIDRIDKLSMRLEDYIKENAARIQRSKNCRIEL